MRITHRARLAAPLLPVLLCLWPAGAGAQAISPEFDLTPPPAIAPSPPVIAPGPPAAPAAVPPPPIIQPAVPIAQPPAVQPPVIRPPAYPAPAMRPAVPPAPAYPAPAPVMKPAAPVSARPVPAPRYSPQVLAYLQRWHGYSTKLGITALAPYHFLSPGCPGCVPYIINCRFPISGLAALRGIRTRTSPATLSWLQAIGGVPVVLSGGDAAGALQNRQIDCVLAGGVRP